jgi:hypothetical protein
MNVRNIGGSTLSRSVSALMVRWDGSISAVLRRLRKDCCTLALSSDSFCTITLRPPLSTTCACSHVCVYVCVSCMRLFGLHSSLVIWNFLHYRTIKLSPSLPMACVLCYFVPMLPDSGSLCLPNGQVYAYVCCTHTHTHSLSLMYIHAYIHKCTVIHICAHAHTCIQRGYSLPVLPDSGSPWPPYRVLTRLYHVMLQPAYEHVICMYVRIMYVCILLMLLLQEMLRASVWACYMYVCVHVCM